MKGKHKYGTHCVVCKEKFTESGSQAHNARGNCRKCYGAWLRRNGFTKCQICGGPLMNIQAKPNCKMCKLKVKKGILQTEKYELSKRQKYYSNHSEKMAGKFDLTKEVLQDIKLILTRYKYKFVNDIDNLRIASIYIDIWGIEPTLDSFDADTQIEFMAKRLDDYYHKNKDLIYN